MKTASQLRAEIDRELAKASSREIIGKSIAQKGSGTADGKDLFLYGDGALTVGRFGTIIKGTGGRTPESIDVGRRVGWYVLDDSILYDADEIPRLVAVAKPILARGGTPGEVRAAFRQKSAKDTAFKPTWTVIEADRSGKTRVRAWKLPRLFGLGGYAVFDDATAPGAAHRGRYQIMQEIGRSGTYAPTGNDFRNLEGVHAWIAEHRALNAR